MVVCVGVKGPVVWSCLDAACMHPNLRHAFLFQPVIHVHYLATDVLFQGMYCGIS